MALPKELPNESQQPRGIVVKTEVRIVGALPTDEMSFGSDVFALEVKKGPTDLVPRESRAGGGLLKGLRRKRSERVDRASDENNADAVPDPRKPPTSQANFSALDEAQRDGLHASAVEVAKRLLKEEPELASNEPELSLRIRGTQAHLVFGIPEQFYADVLEFAILDEDSSLVPDLPVQEEAPQGGSGTSSEPTRPADDDGSHPVKIGKDRGSFLNKERQFVPKYPGWEADQLGSTSSSRTAAKGPVSSPKRGQPKGDDRGSGSEEPPGEARGAEAAEETTQETHAHQGEGSRTEERANRLFGITTFQSAVQIHNRAVRAGLFLEDLTQSQIISLFRLFEENRGQVNSTDRQGSANTAGEFIALVRNMARNGGSISPETLSPKLRERVKELGENTFHTLYSTFVNDAEGHPTLSCGRANIKTGDVPTITREELVGDLTTIQRELAHLGEGGDPITLEQYIRCVQSLLPFVVQHVSESDNDPSTIFDAAAIGQLFTRIMGNRANSEAPNISERYAAVLLSHTNQNLVSILASPTWREISPQDSLEQGMPDLTRRLIGEIHLPMAQVAIRTARMREPDALLSVAQRSSDFNDQIGAVEVKYVLDDDTETRWVAAGIMVNDTKLKELAPPPPHLYAINAESGDRVRIEQDMPTGDYLIPMGYSAGTPKEFARDGLDLLTYIALSDKGMRVENLMQNTIAAARAAGLGAKITAGMLQSLAIGAIKLGKLSATVGGATAGIIGDNVPKIAGAAFAALEKVTNAGGDLLGGVVGAAQDVSAWALHTAEEAVRGAFGIVGELTGEAKSLAESIAASIGEMLGGAGGLLGNITNVFGTDEGEQGEGPVEDGKTENSEEEGETPAGSEEVEEDDQKGPDVAAADEHGSGTSDDHGGGATSGGVGIGSIIGGAAKTGGTVASWLFNNIPKPHAPNVEGVAGSIRGRAERPTKGPGPRIDVEDDDTVDDAPDTHEGNTGATGTRSSTDSQSSTAASDGHPERQEVVDEEMQPSKAQREDPDRDAAEAVDVPIDTAQEEDASLEDLLQAVEEDEQGQDDTLQEGTVFVAKEPIDEDS